MDSPTLILTDLPELSDESIGQLNELLYAFMNAFEERYYTQLLRYYQTHEIRESPEPPDDDLFDDFDDIPF